MSRRKKWLLLIVFVLVLAIILVPVLGDFARELVAIPLLYVLWLGGLFFRSIPQLLFWALFVAIAVVIAVRSLGGRLRRSRKRKAWTVRAGRVQTLAAWIRHAKRRGYYRRRLAHTLAELTVGTLAYRDWMPERHLAGYLEQLDMPSEVRAYLEAGLELGSPRVGFLTRLARRLGLDRGSLPLDSDLERVVEFLERSCSL